MLYEVITPAPVAFPFEGRGNAPIAGLRDRVRLLRTVADPEMGQTGGTVAAPILPIDEETHVLDRAVPASYNFV